MIKNKMINPNEKRLVKYNKKKITIISLIVIAIIVGTSLGIYYAVRPKAAFFSKNVSVSSSSTIRSKIKNIKVDEVIGVYFYNKESTEDKDMVYGLPEKEDGDHDVHSLDGAFSDYSSSLEGIDSIKWYSYQKSKDDDISNGAAEILLNRGKDKTPTWPFVEGEKEFSTIGNYLGKIGEEITNSVSAVELVAEERDDKKHKVNISGNSEITEFSGSTFMWFKLTEDIEGNQTIIWSIAQGIEDPDAINELDGSIWETAQEWVEKNGLIN